MKQSVSYLPFVRTKTTGETKNLQVTNQLSEDAWRGFVENHPQGNIFHTPEIFQVFSRAHKNKPTLWAVVTPGGDALALMTPVEVTVLNGVFRSYTTRAVVYGSVLCDESQEGREALALLLRTYAQENKGRLLFTELRNLSDLTGLIPTLNAYGFAYEEHLNFLIDLNRPTQEIWQSIRSNARRNIQKAQKSGVTIEEVEDLEGISRAYPVIKDVYKRVQVPLADVSLFQAAFETLTPKGMLRTFIARVEGNDIGALMLLLYKGLVYYWYTGTLREFASYRPGDLLVWHSLEFGSQNGYRLYDFGGGGKPEEEYGVRDFKAKFGGTLVNFGRNVCVHSPLRLKLSQEGYQMMRKFL
jgi:hypothetical protein